MKNLCFLFLDYLHYTKKVSPHTLKSYELDLKQFFGNKLENETKPKKLEKEIRQKIEITTKKWNHLSPSSQTRKLSSAKSFIRWLFENHYIEQDLRFLFKSPRSINKIPLFLSVDEIFSIIDTMEKARQKKEPYIERDQALFFLLYGGGLRVSEACHLRCDQIDWAHQLLRIRGKGKKERIISLPEKVMPYLERAKNPDFYFFGKKPLSVRKAYDIVKKWGQKSHILKPIHPHALRHSFATHLLVGGSDIRVLQELMGHKTLSATQKYTHLNIHQLSHTLDKCHPLNK